MPGKKRMIVVTGAAGNLGRLVAAGIARQRKTAGVRLGSRTPEKIADLAREGFETAHVDFDEPQSLRNAFAGAQTVLLISTDTLDAEIRCRQHRAAVDAARKAAVERIVYTSFSNASPASHFPAAMSHADTEDYLKTSDVPYTILRVNPYFENLDGNLLHAIRGGILALPGAQGKAAYISRSDVAQAVVGALFGGSHVDKTYELTGPEALDLAGIAAALSAAVRRPVAAVDVSEDAFAQQLSAAGLAQPIIRQLLGLYSATAAGEYARVSSDAAALSQHALTGAVTYMQKFAG
jgi:NAD(P)H dehydrogenase (quinone)